MLLSPIWTALAYMATTVEAHRSLHRRAPDSSDLVLTLTASSSGKATEVQATIKNAGSANLSLLKLGTILDNGPVKKVTVVDENGTELPFQGIMPSIFYDGLTAKNFEDLKSGASVVRTIDLAAVYDFEAGNYFVIAEGTIATVPDGSTAPVAYSYKSEAISITIKTASTASVMQKLARRTTVVTDNCTAEIGQATFNSVRNCETLARAAAADAADVTSKRFVEYFKSNETSARNHVSGRLLAVAEECSTTNGGQTRVACYDDIGYCESDGPLVAYTTWVNGWVTLCRLFWERPPLPQLCHKQDHATTLIHEMTHARAVYEQEVSTQDYAYGYENSTALDPTSCLYNADSYSLYANAVYMNC